MTLSIIDSDSTHLPPSIQSIPEQGGAIKTSRQQNDNFLSGLHLSYWLFLAVATIDTPPRDFCLILTRMSCGFRTLNSSSQMIEASFSQK